MNHSRRFVGLIAILCAGLVLDCRLVRIHRPARPGGQDLIVLLPDAEDGTLGRAVASNSAGTAELAAARESTSVSANRPPKAVRLISEADVQRLFGDTLSALPPAPQHFTLYFLFESIDLTDESRALVPQILQAVRDRRFPDVAVVGHTDTTGTPPSNFELGLMRANAIRSLLVDVGIDPSLVEATSHGEADLLIKTADEVSEPGNRRVEITVR
jgi:outer membrane protein OmpA-like peptidoglycan-associated protein